MNILTILSKTEPPKPRPKLPLGYAATGAALMEQQAGLKPKPAAIQDASVEVKSEEPDDEDSEEE